MTIILNQTSRGQTLWRSMHLETDTTTCSHIAKIDNSAFSDACKSYHFSAIPLHSHVVKMHGHSKQSGRSGFDHFSADKTCT